MRVARRIDRRSFGSLCRRRLATLASSRGSPSTGWPSDTGRGVATYGHGGSAGQVRRPVPTVHLGLLGMVATMKIAVLAGDRRCFVVAEVLHALFGLEVVLDPEALAAGVDPREPDCRSRSYAATCAGSRGQTSGWSPGARSRETASWSPTARRSSAVPCRHPLLGVDEVLELRCVAHEKHGCVVADQIEIAQTAHARSTSSSSTSSRDQRRSAATDGLFGLILADLYEARRGHSLHSRRAGVRLT